MTQSVRECECGCRQSAGVVSECWFCGAEAPVVLRDPPVGASRSPEPLGSSA